MVGFEEQPELGPVVLAQLTTVGLGGMGRIGGDTDPGQVQVRQMGGDGRFLIGVAGHGHLVNEPLRWGDEVDQRQSLVGFGLLQFGRDFARLGRSRRGRCGRGASGSRLGIFEHLAIQVY